MKFRGGGSIKYRYYSDILLKKNIKFIKAVSFSACVNMVSATSASRYIRSASSYHHVIKVDLDVHPWSDYTEFHGIGRGCSH